MSPYKGRRGDPSQGEKTEGLQQSSESREDVTAVFEDEGKDHVPRHVGSL